MSAAGPPQGAHSERGISREGSPVIGAAPAKLPVNLDKHRRLSQWLRVDADGTVRMFTGKVELGQGILTALAQIVADELDVAVARIRLVTADTAATPDEGVTSGSLSVQEGGSALRQAAAEVRHLLLAEIAAEYGVDAASLTVEDGTVRLPNGRTTTYWTFANSVSLDREATGSVAPKPRSALRIVGTNTPRVDLPGKFTGQPVFVQDLELPGMLHARVVRPAWRSARLLELDVERVKAMTGVVAVIVEGRFLAVVAEREEQALRAVRRIQAIGRWSDPVEPGRPMHPKDFPSVGTRDEVNAEKHDAVAAARAARTIEAEYTRPYIAHASIGPSCAVAHLVGDAMTIWCHSQSIGPLRREIARVLDWPESRLRVAHVQGSGCYGHNGADDVALDAALIARALPGRPIRLQWTREDEFTCEPYGSAMLVRLSAALDADGRIVDWRHDLWSHAHTARPGAADGISLMAGFEVERGLRAADPRDPPLPSGGAHRNAIPLYDFPNLRVAKHHVTDPVLRVSSLRSLGAHGNVFAIESFMDELAHAVGADPVEFRLRHLADARASAVIEAAAAMAEWPSRPAGEGRGYGFAFAKYKNTGSYVAVVAEVEAGEDIRLVRAWAAVDVGLAVNPDGVAAQIEGGIVQAASWTLKESVAYDGETVLARNWNDYPILGFEEAPEVRVRVIDSDAPWVGAGEGAQGPTAAAIANAVFAALGARVRDMPITRDRVVSALAT